MSHSNNYGDYTSGSILKISSASGGGYDPVRITQALDEEKYEKGCFEISFLPVKDKPDSTNKLCVPERALVPYKLEENHLVKLGFKEEKHYYIKDKIVIGKISFSTQNETGLTLNDWGLCVIEVTQYEAEVSEGKYYIDHDYILSYKGSKQPPLEKINELKSITTPVYYIHKLQNYWKERTGSELNVDMLDFS